jgi:hypothetical protein
VHQRDDPVGDEDPDAVEEEEQQGLAAPVAALAVPERPELVAEEREHSGQDVGERRRGYRTQPGAGVEDVDQDDSEHEREHAHDPELGDLMDQQPKSRVKVADKLHRRSVPLSGPSRNSQTLPPLQVLLGTGR